MRDKPTCSYKGCVDPRYCRGYCIKHYERWRKYGDPSVRLVLRGEPPEVRFWAKVDKNGPGGCWLWTGALASGYGVLGIDGRNVFAHRFAYELLIGPIPEGLTLDHLCRIRRCCNPSHLEIVTRGENVLRGEGPTARHARKTHCKRGHPFDEANTYRTPKGRHCRACRRLHEERWRLGRKSLRRN